MASGCLLGFVDGSLILVVGGLALVTFGRALRLESRATILAAASVAVLAGALGVGALRWGSLELAPIRGAQSVLGPTVLVGPPRSATGAILGLAAALLAVMVWGHIDRNESLPDRILHVFESAIAAVALMSMFGAVPLDPAGVGLWGAAIAVVVGGVWLVDLGLSRAPEWLTWTVIVVAAGLLAGASAAILVPA